MSATVWVIGSKWPKAGRLAGAASKPAVLAQGPVRPPLLASYGSAAFFCCVAGLSTAHLAVEELAGTLLHGGNGEAGHLVQPIMAGGLFIRRFELRRK